MLVAKMFYSILFHRSMERLQAIGGLVARIFLEPAPPPPTHFLHFTLQICYKCISSEIDGAIHRNYCKWWWIGGANVLRTDATSTHPPTHLFHSFQAVKLLLSRRLITNAFPQKLVVQSLFLPCLASSSPCCLSHPCTSANPCPCARSEY